MRKNQLIMAESLSYWEIGMGLILAALVVLGMASLDATQHARAAGNFPLAWFTEVDPAPDSISAQAQSLANDTPGEPPPRLAILGPDRLLFLSA